MDFPKTIYIGETNYIQYVQDILSKKIDVESDLLDLYTLLVLTSGIDTAPIDVHDAWAIWRNKTNPNHKSLIPFFELTPEVQELDIKYVNAIRETASELKEVKKKVTEVKLENI